MVPKVYTVFNIAQTEDIEFAKPVIGEKRLIGKIESCEELIRGMPQPPVIQLNGAYPVYYPQRDLMAVPDLSAFECAEEYYCALFHELAHSTSHAKRLDRKEITELTGYGSEPYSREELTAELTAAFLCVITGIGQSTIENSAAYL